jgi:hypothetical protein
LSNTIANTSMPGAMQAHAETYFAEGARRK